MVKHNVLHFLPPSLHNVPLFACESSEYITSSISAILESSRGYITLGASVTHGIEIKGVDTLQDCIKKCATAGGGIAAINAEIATTPQICCNLDYDFATHKCYFHPCVDMTIAVAQFCAAVPEAPLNSIRNPSSISITLCKCFFLRCSVFLSVYMPRCSEFHGSLKSKRKAHKGRTRVYYSVTAKGQRRLQKLTGDWDRINSGVRAALEEGANA